MMTSNINLRTVGLVAWLTGVAFSDEVLADFCSGGYANYRLPPGYSLLSRALHGPTNNVQDFVDDAQLQNGYSIFTIEEGRFRAANYLNGWSNPDLPLRSGAGWFFKNPFSSTVFLSAMGAVDGGTNGLPAGLSVCGSKLPVHGALNTELAFPAAQGDTVYLFNNADNSYLTYSFSGTWSPRDPVIGYFEGFWVRKAVAARWVQPPGCRWGPTTQTTANSSEGQLNFFTFNATNGQLGRVFAGDAVTPLSVGYVAQLYAGTNDSSLTVVGSPAGFSNNAAGYVQADTVSIPFVSGGQAVYVQLRAWSQFDGGSYEAASANGGSVGTSEVMLLTAHAAIEDGQPGLPPPDVNAFTSFHLDRPGLSIVARQNDVVVSWPSPSTGYALEEANAAGGASWTSVEQTPADDGRTKSVVIAIGASEKFYRLKK